jgi:hypothetical protein
MSSRCCVKPIATIIKVESIDVGIVGLETVLHNVYISGVKDEVQIKTDLVQRVKEFGNYISPSRENDYKQALLREYRKHIESIEHKAAKVKIRNDNDT